MEAKSKDEGVIATGTGLLYKIIKKGDGKISPKETQTVIVHYKGAIATSM